jgi:hypothetical protein
MAICYPGGLHGRLFEERIDEKQTFIPLYPADITDHHLAFGLCTTGIHAAS